jgi:hypothetical protein
MMMGETCWNWNGEGQAVLRWWAHQATSDKTPRELTYSCRSHFGPLDMNTMPADTPQQICIQPFYYGSAAKGTEVVRTAFATLPQPVSDASHAMPWINDVEHEHAKVTALYGLNVHIRSAFFDSMPAELVDMLHGAVASAPSIGNCIIDFDHLSGAISAVSPSATAYVNRAAKTNLQIIATWAQGDERAHEFVAWADNLFNQISNFTSASYVNYVDTALPNWQQKYYGGNYQRLKAVKAAVDPQRFFTSPRAIGL